MNEYIQAALAGLLHDVGKIEQRARVDPWNPAPGIDNPGRPVHASWTAYFAQTYLPKRYQGAALHGAYHHHPDQSPAQDKRLSKLIALADKLSAGERADQPEKYPKKHPPQQMVSIFDQIALNGNPRTKDFHYLPLKRLALNEDALFPKDAEAGEVQAEAYETLRYELEQAARRDPDDDETYLENLLGAMQRTTWCVPSAYYHSLPDISLYDHSRMTAALAVCLAEKDEGEIEALLGAVARDFQKKPARGDEALLAQDAALLVGGDLSGVQKFIYTLSSKRAAKTLRGRSFYLQLLTEAVLRYVLRELGLPATNVIYAGGGHFYLLAPLNVASRLTEIQKHITRTLLQHHGTSLYLALGCAEVPASGFRRGHFPEHWKQMHRQLNLAKQRRYTELDDELFEKVLAPQSHGGNKEETCSVCGEERAQVEPLDEAEQDASPDDPKPKICSLCDSFDTKIGKRLPRASFVVLGFGEAQKTEPGTALDVLRAFGMVIDWADNAREQIAFGDSVARAVVWALDDAERWPVVKGVPAANLTRYTVNLIPIVRDKDEADEINKHLSKAEKAEDPARPHAPKTFTHLQAQATGIKRLGVLRMDVDNLGDIFIRGFGRGEDSRATLARLSTLSFQMALFFEGWIKRLCEKYPGLIYAVYAGGDDVFLIGPWNVMPDLAQDIVADLTRFTGANPDLHLSGGMAFIHGKYPVYQAADDAGEAESQAKNIDEEKNAFSFLDTPWKWDDFEKVREKFVKIEHIVRTEKDGGLGGPKALIQTLRRLALDEAEERKKADGKKVYGPWMWRGVYLLKRMEERAGKKKPELTGKIKEVRISLDEDDFGNLDQWGAAARWAQLLIREHHNG